MTEPAPRPDQEAVGHRVAGNPLERLLARFEGLARRMARRRGLAGDDVDEVLQDVRIRVWKARGTDENPDALGTSYLMRVVTTAVIDHIRKRQRSRTVTLSEVSETAMPDAMRVAADDGSEREAIAARLARALATLPDNRRLAVQLHLDGYARDDIAHLTGWTEAKVRNLLYRGLDDLRGALRDGGDADA